MRKDYFTDEAVKAARALAEFKYSENPEDQLAFTEAYDFARCQRPNGSHYPIPDGKQCRKGSKAGDAESKPAMPKDSRKATLRVSPRQAAKVLEGQSAISAAKRFKNSDFDPDKVGYKKAGQNISEAKKAGKSPVPDAQKRVNKAIKLINERIKKLREAELNPETGKNSQRIGRLQERQRELKTMAKYIKSGNAGLASQAVLEKSLR
jgi:hypothetical protein